MITSKDGTPITQAIREALADLDETQRDKIARADLWRLVLRGGKWTFIVPAREPRSLRAKKVHKP